MNPDGSLVLISSTRSADSPKFNLCEALRLGREDVECGIFLARQATKQSDRRPRQGEDAKIVFIVQYSLTGRGSDWSLHGPAKNLVKSPGGQLHNRAANCLAPLGLLKYLSILQSAQ